MSKKSAFCRTLLPGTYLPPAFTPYEFLSAGFAFPAISTFAAGTLQEVMHVCMMTRTGIDVLTVVWLNKIWPRVLLRILSGSSIRKRWFDRKFYAIKGLTSQRWAHRLKRLTRCWPCTVQYSINRDLFHSLLNGGTGPVVELPRDLPKRGWSLGSLVPSFLFFFLKGSLVLPFRENPLEPIIPAEFRNKAKMITFSAVNFCQGPRVHLMNDHGQRSATHNVEKLHLLRDNGQTGR